MMKADVTASRIGELQGFESPLKSNPKQNGDDFVKALQTEMGKSAEVRQVPVTPQGVKFSNHAIERIQSRGIQLQKTDLQRLNDAVEKAAAKGSKESLILMGENAFVVSVRNKTVITAMDQAMLKENVFTNIDSTIVL